MMGRTTSARRARCDDEVGCRGSEAWKERADKTLSQEEESDRTNEEE
jgi:hypothetical protein